MTESSDHPVVRAHRDVVERLWTAPILHLCASELPAPDQATVLSAESRCGAVILRWIQDLPAGTRMMALDSQGIMLDEARSRVPEEEHRRIFFVQQRLNALSYADGVFNGVVCLHGMVTRRQGKEGLQELARVTAPEGKLVVSFPLVESFSEFYDLLDEALRASNLESALPRLTELRENLITEKEVAQFAESLGLEVLELSEMSWEVAFGNGREYLYSPLVQETFFPHWIGAIRASDREEVLRYISTAFDTYWRARTLNSTVKAALLVARKPAE